MSSLFLGSHVLVPLVLGVYHPVIVPVKMIIPEYMVITASVYLSLKPAPL